MRFRRPSPSLCLPGLLAAAVLCLAACEPTGPELPEVTFHATWAGNAWHGEASATFPAGTDSVFIFGVSPVGAGQVPHTYVRIGVAYTGPGTYALGPGAAELHVLLGGDVVTATYGTTATQGGTLVITARTATHLHGTVDFETQSLREHSPYGDRARFTGTFDAAIATPP